jgi:hypothetical protein
MPPLPLPAGRMEAAIYLDLSLRDYRQEAAPLRPPPACHPKVINSIRRKRSQ